MKQKIGILNYGDASNLYNVKKALEASKKLVDDIVIVDVNTSLDKIDKLIIPGVGSFKYVANQLSSMSQDLILFSKRKWILGICVGMQVLCQSGDEIKYTQGVGIFEGHVTEVDLPIKPNIGFHEVRTINSNSAIFNLLPPSNDFYFMHSFAVKRSEDATSMTISPVSFVATMQKNYAIGVQFHPEKSKEIGLKFIKSFLEL